MNRTERDYVVFEQAMNERGLFRECPDFLEICSLIGADPVSLDQKIYEELGWRGQALVDFYLRCENCHY